MQQKYGKTFFVFQIIAFELVGIISPNTTRILIVGSQCVNKLSKNLKI